MPSFEVILTTHGRAVVADIRGYFNDEAGRHLQERLKPLLKKGSNRILLDFSRCEVINSPGVAGLLETAVEVIEDHRGMLVLCGLQETSQNILQMAGLFIYATATADRTTGLAALEKT
ncbi:MAG: STAS domain-containing protein [Candidatus Riflebacteria bacterium]|nr:STAS domain-containing protein [Candidatus Riflebacteria bacterium]